MIKPENIMVEALQGAISDAMNRELILRAQLVEERAKSADLAAEIAELKKAEAA